MTHAKYLGVTLSRDQSWRQHIEAVAGQNLGFIRWNLSGTPTRSKITAYFTLVCAGLEYGTPVWDPYLHKDISTPSRGYNNRQHAGWSPSTHTPPVSQASLWTIGGSPWQSGEPAKNFAYSIKSTPAQLISSSRTLVWATPDARLMRDLYSQKSHQL